MAFLQALGASNAVNDTIKGLQGIDEAKQKQALTAQTMGMNKQTMALQAQSMQQGAEQFKTQQALAAPAIDKAKRDMEMIIPNEKLPQMGHDEIDQGVIKEQLINSGVDLSKPTPRYILDGITEKMNKNLDLIATSYGKISAEALQQAQMLDSQISPVQADIKAELDKYRQKYSESKVSIGITGQPTGGIDPNHPIGDDNALMQHLMQTNPKFKKMVDEQQALAKQQQAASQKAKDATSRSNALSITGQLKSYVEDAKSQGLLTDLDAKAVYAALRNDPTGKSPMAMANKLVSAREDKAKAQETKSMTKEQLYHEALYGTDPKKKAEAKGILDAEAKDAASAAKQKLEISMTEKDKGMDVPGLAQAVANGQDSADRIKGSMGNPVSSKVKSEVLKQYPKFNFAKAEANYKGTTNQSFIGAKANVDSVIESAELAKQYIQALNNGNLQYANQIANKYSEVTGSPAPTNWKTFAVAMAQEFNRAYSDSVVNPEGRFNKELSNLDVARSPQQLLGSIDTNLKLTQIRKRAIEKKMQPYSWDEVRGTESSSPAETQPSGGQGGGKTRTFNPATGNLE
jgi:hypothetical protein